LRTNSSRIPSAAVPGKPGKAGKPGKPDEVIATVFISKSQMSRQ
jgi:hypothetical protein